MNHETFEPALSSDLSPRPPQNVVVYEDSETFRRVNPELRALFGCQLVDDCRSVAWKFDLLEHQPLFQQALDDALAADLIVVTAHGHASLPAGVKAWIEQWRAHTTTDAGLLVLLLDDSLQHHPHAVETLQYLKTAAQNARFGWYQSFCELPGAKPN